MTTIWQDAVDSLPIGHVMEMGNAVFDAEFQKCRDARMSPIDYLVKTFKHPATLMSAMFDTGCVISGSRALEFFVPGSTRPDSDWDFYVPGYNESVADMVNALSVCGVSWELEADAINTALAKNETVEVQAAVMEALFSWTRNLETSAAISLVGHSLHNVLLRFRDDAVHARSYTITTVSGNIVVTANEGEPQTDPTYTDPLGGSFNIMHGSIPTAEGKQRVQLIIGCYYSGIKSCLNFIKDFYASHVQCFISGWCAAHLYYRLASLKQAILWKQPSKTSAVQKAIKKYEERGFVFSPADKTVPITRSLWDEHALLMDFGELYRPLLRPSQYDLLDLWLSERRQNIYSIRWVEFDSKVFAMSSPMEAWSRYQDTYSATRDGLHVICLHRLGDLVAHNIASSDSLRCHSFESVLNKTLRGEKWKEESVAKSGTIYSALCDATPWSWML